MAPGWTIRAATGDDIPALTRVHARAIRVTGIGHYTKEEVASWAAGLDAAFYRRALARTDLFVVAEAEGAGVVALGASRRDEVWLLYTDPDWAGRGIGGALLARLEDDIRTRGHRVLRVESSLAARGFYERHGYRRRRIYGHRTRGGMVLAALTMTKPAAGATAEARSGPDG